ncbi:ferric reductase-like transmembrane domain-containing protein [Dechloromonas denitrificans]|uniref:ferredoxin reductase family protein n=1 Tax=Dechloromonas denitrificans TaxID=281362 RepID=UPI001CF8D645|nr:ferric reductase-like transmembrane domain-containing protein [Dechloromonas denitrificans]UCV05178.1 ferric reductase-like transmembrane domain-containing protein [Dechloromonas denitrificans]
MKIIKYTLVGYLALLSAAWWLTDQADLFNLAGFFPWRNVLSQYTGVIAIGVMSLAMILSARPVFLERYFGGLDKMYRLHKWLGISALVISISHWLIADGPKWLVQLGWLTRPGGRGPRPVLPEGSLQQIFLEQRGLAEGIGEWAFYGAVLLMVLALVKRFPYKRFFQTHKILAVAYLALVFHAVVLVKFDYWSGLVGPLLIVLMTLGSIAAVMSLTNRRAGGKRALGKVLAIEQLAALGVAAIEVQLDSGWPGHKPGQFAFVTFHEDEGPHPFTIASAWQEDGRIRFLVKALGDYTRSLPKRLKVGDSVKLEGPYGQFTFEGNAPRQIWIGGGIGITPFIARMKALAGQPDGKAVDLFHCTADYDQAAVDKLTRDAAAAKVSLHVLWDQRDGRLDLQRLIENVPNWREADVWFCGPARFGQAIRDGLGSLGFPGERFHQELFEMR